MKPERVKVDPRHPLAMAYRVLGYELEAVLVESRAGRGPRGAGREVLLGVALNAEEARLQGESARDAVQRRQKVSPATAGRYIKQAERLLEDEPEMNLKSRRSPVGTLPR